MLKKKYCSVREAAEFSSLSSRFLYKKVQNKEIKFYRAGKRILISLEDLIGFIEQGLVEPIDWEERARELNK